MGMAETQHVNEFTVSGMVMATGKASRIDFHYRTTHGSYSSAYILLTYHNTFVQQLLHYKTKLIQGKTSPSHHSAHITKYSTCREKRNVGRV